MGANFKHLNRKYYMHKSNVYSKWKHACDNNEVIRMCMQAKELINIRDRCKKGIFKRGECNDIIDLLCTGGLFCPFFIIVLYVLFYFEYVLFNYGE